MFFTSVFASSLSQCRQALLQAEAGEIRLDAGGLTTAEVQQLFSEATIPLLATHQGPGGVELLLAAVEAGAALVDCDVANDDQLVIAAARKYGCRVVVSYHNFEHTPMELDSIVTRCFEQGADIAKLACQANSAHDAIRLIALMQQKDVVAIGMGRMGIITRVAGAWFNAPLVFVSADPDSSTAAGQLSADQLRQVLHLLKR